MNENNLENYRAAVEYLSSQVDYLNIINKHLQQIIVELDHENERLAREYSEITSLISKKKLKKFLNNKNSC